MGKMRDISDFDGDMIFDCRNDGSSIAIDPYAFQFGLCYKGL